MSCSIGPRCGLDLVWMWLWLWCRQAAPIHLLAWEPPYATGAAKKQKEKKKDGSVVEGREQAESRAHLVDLVLGLLHLRGHLPELLEKGVSANIFILLSHLNGN